MLQSLGCFHQVKMPFFVMPWKLLACATHLNFSVWWWRLVCVWCVRTQRSLSCLAARISSGPLGLQHSPGIFSARRRQGEGSCASRSRLSRSPRADSRPRLEAALSPRWWWWLHAKDRKWTLITWWIFNSRTESGVFVKWYMMGNWRAPAAAARLELVLWPNLELAICPFQPPTPRQFVLLRFERKKKHNIL